MKKETKLLMEDVISFETAKLAKQAGFWYDGRTNDWLNTTLPYHENGKREINFNYDGETWGAPTQALLQKWLREKHKIFVEVNYRTFGVKSGNGYFYICGSKKYHNMNSYFGETIWKGFDTYENALEIGLQSGLKIIINKKADEKRNKKKEKV